MQNGVDYGHFESILPKEKLKAFDPERFGNDSQINQSLGILPRVFLTVPGTLRSKHPSVSWGANGDQPEFYTVPHPPNDPNSPLKRLAERRGYVLLLGVALSSCSALHLAEELAGRRPFIRWALYPGGAIRRVREYGCSNGFVNLEEQLGHLARSVFIGSCRARAYHVRELADRAAELIRRKPQLTICRKRCQRCLDAVEGGPIESGEHGASKHA